MSRYNRDSASIQHSSSYNTSDALFAEADFYYSAGNDGFYNFGMFVREQGAGGEFLGCRVDVDSGTGDFAIVEGNFDTGWTVLDSVDVNQTAQQDSYIPVYMAILPGDADGTAYATVTYQNTTFTTGEVSPSITGSGRVGFGQFDLSNTGGDNWFDDEAVTYREPIPDAPTNLSATPVARGEFDLDWSGSDGANDYRVYRAESSGFAVDDYSPVTTTAATSYTDTGLEDGEQYYYRVTARNSDDEESDPSNEAAAVAPIPVGTATAAGGYRQVTVDWDKIDNSPDGTWGVERTQESGSSSWTVVGDGLDPSTTSYTDTGLEDGEQYYYRVRRLTDHADDVGTSDDATTDLPAPTLDSLDASTRGEITANYTLNDNSTELGIEVALSSDGGDTFDEVDEIFTDGASEASYTFSGLPDGTDYTVIAARVTEDASSDTVSGTTQTILPAPTDLTVTDVRDDAADVRVEDNANNKQGYRVFAGPQSDNILDNPGFEDDPVGTSDITGWTVVSGNDAWDVTEEYSAPNSSGTKSVGSHWQDQPDGWPLAYLYQDINATDQDSVYVSGWVHLLSAIDSGWTGAKANQQYVYEDDVRWHFKYYDANGDLIDEETSRWLGDAYNRGLDWILERTSENWFHIEHWITPPDGTETVRVQLDGGDNNNGYQDPDADNGNAAVWFDDFEARKAPLEQNGGDLDPRYALRTSDTEDDPSIPSEAVPYGDEAAALVTIEVDSGSPETGFEFADASEWRLYVYQQGDHFDINAQIDVIGDGIQTVGRYGPVSCDERHTLGFGYKNGSAYKLYLDGEEVVSADSLATGEIKEPSDLTFNNRGTHEVEFEDVNLLNRLPTTEELAAYHNQPDFEFPQSALTGRYDIDNRIDTSTLTDSSGNGFDGANQTCEFVSTVDPIRYTLSDLRNGEAYVTRASVFTEDTEVFDN